MSSSTTYPDRVRLPLNYDAGRMLAEVQAMDLNHFIHYNVLPLRSPAHFVDPSLPPPPPADDYADGSWTDWANTKTLQNSPYLKSIVDSFCEHTNVTLVRVLRLAAGNTVERHTDPTLGLEVHKSVVRLTIPISGNDQVEFLLNDTPVPMQAGECWYMRLTDPHQVNNPGDTERINLTIDMIPNEWLRSLIRSAAQA